LGLRPQPPTPNPQSPIPNPHPPNYLIYFMMKNIINNNLSFECKNKIINIKSNYE